MTLLVMQLLCNVCTGNFTSNFEYIWSTLFWECSHCWLWLCIFFLRQNLRSNDIILKNIFEQMILYILQWYLFQTHFFWKKFHISCDNFILSAFLLIFFFFFSITKMCWKPGCLSKTWASFYDLFFPSFDCFYICSTLLHSFPLKLSEQFQSKLNHSNIYLYFYLIIFLIPLGEYPNCHESSN